MSPLPFISHRMFVAAVGADEHPQRKPALPESPSGLLRNRPRHRPDEVFELTPVPAAEADNSVAEPVGLSGS